MKVFGLGRPMRWFLFGLVFLVILSGFASYWLMRQFRAMSQKQTIDVHGAKPSGR